MDQELVQYLNERFADFNERFAGVDRQFDHLRGEVHEGFEGLRGEMHEGLGKLRGEMCEGLDEVKRHNGILIEDLRYKVQLVAEGFATFVEGRYAQDQARIDERFRETHALIRSSYDHLNQRLENLERRSQS